MSAGTTAPATVADVRSALASGQFLWLDLVDVDDEARTMLRDDFGCHPLAIEDAASFRQRPKIDDYDNCDLMVVHGAAGGGIGVVELHLLFSTTWVVTIHQDECGAIAAAHTRISHHPTWPVPQPVLGVIYLIVDELIDGFFPVLDEFDNRIDDMEDAILANPTDEQLGQLFQMKRQLVMLRKVMTPQRDVFSSIVSGVVDIPGMDDEGQRYFRDLYDHVIRISDMVDSYRDLLGGAMDTHVAAVSNRLNVVMKQLTIIATVFLPLSFLTGFFGQNFAWLVTRITSLWTFLVFAVGIELACAIGLLVWFRRRGWLGGPTV